MTSQDRWARIQMRIVRLVWADGLSQTRVTWSGGRQRFGAWEVVPVDAALVVEVDAGVDQHDKDHCDDPVDDQAERRPPASVSNILAAVLPQVLEPMAGEAATSSQAGPVTPAAATTTKAAAMPASTAITVGRPTPGRAGARRRQLRQGSAGRTP